MAKKIDIAKITIGSIGTASKWYKSTAQEILSNTSQSDIRLDKVMMQISASSDFVAPGIMGVVVHLTDETGADMVSSVTAGTTDDAALEVLLNQWKDNVFMTDFRFIGTGADETVQPVIPLEADTRRLLKPGQKLYVSILVQPVSAETTKTLSTYLDSIIWYSAAAN